MPHRLHAPKPTRPSRVVVPPPPSRPSRVVAPPPSSRPPLSALQSALLVLPGLLPALQAILSPDTPAGLLLRIPLLVVMGLVLLMLCQARLMPGGVILAGTQLLLLLNLPGVPPAAVGAAALLLGGSLLRLAARSGTPS